MFRVWVLGSQLRLSVRFRVEGLLFKCTDLVAVVSSTFWGVGFRVRVFRFKRA